MRISQKEITFATEKPRQPLSRGYRVERFGLLATTIKNAKNLVCQGHSARSYPSILPFFPQKMNY